MAATTIVNIHHGAGPTVASAESGVTFARADGVNPTTPVPKPTATGTAFSWPKWLRLRVSSGGGSTAISARTVKLGSSPTTGLKVHFKNGGTSYSQAAANADSDSGSNGAVPSTYTEMSTSAQSYDADSESATNSTDNGDFLLVAAGVSNNYAGGAGSAIALPNIVVGYTEA